MKLKLFIYLSQKEWDFITNKGQLIKLPVNNYKQKFRKLSKY